MSVCLRVEGGGRATHLCHFALGVLDAHGAAVGRVQVSSQEGGHRVSGAPHVLELDERHRAPPLQVHAQATEPREAVRVRSGVQQHMW